MNEAAAGSNLRSRGIGNVNVMAEIF